MCSDLRFDIVNLLREKSRHCDIAEIARNYGITIEKNGSINKGWVGQTLDRITETKGLSASRPDGEDYELKCVHVVDKSGEWVPKETIAVTMMNPQKIILESFEDSTLWHKLSRLILVGHSYPDASRKSAFIRFISPVDVTDPALYGSIEDYWNSIRRTVLDGKIASYSSKGTSSGFIQLRTKGSKASKSTCPITGLTFKSRAFYATKPFINYVRGNLY